MVTANRWARLENHVDRGGFKRLASTLRKNKENNKSKILKSFILFF